MIKVSRALTVFAVLLFLVFLGGGVPAFAAFVLNGNPADTTAETTVISTGTDNKANYSDANLNPRDQLTGANTFSITVTAEYGLCYPNDGLTKFSTRGFPRTFLWLAENDGNAPMTFTLTWESYPSTSPAAKGWVFDVYNYPSGTPLASNTEFTVPDDSAVAWGVTITPSLEASDSPDTSSGHLNFTLKMKDNYPTPGSETLQTDYTGYTGVNGKEYGGLTINMLGVEDILTIKTPVLTMTRTATIDSPNNYVLGTKHDAVPGALYSSVVNVSNEGSDVAKFVVIIDKVPEHMVAYKMNVQNPEDNVNVTSPNIAYYNPGGLNNWNCYVTSEATPDMSFGAPGWVYVTTFEASPVAFPTGDVITYVKFEKGYGTNEDLESGAWVRLQWSAYIK